MPLSSKDIEEKISIADIVTLTLVGICNPDLATCGFSNPLKTIYSNFIKSVNPHSANAVS